ncbi:MAG: hypothetical protein WC152_07200 [Candidatus Izemoplasmatales bacterium]
MKKFSVLFLGIILIFVMIGCSNFSTATPTTTSIPQISSTETSSMSLLSTPTNISVTANVITFNEVENATKYRVFIYDATEQLAGEYNITNNFDLSLLIGLGSYTLRLIATGPQYLDSEFSEQVSFSIVSPNQTNLLEGADMNNFEYIRWLGRTFYDEVKEAKYFYFTASGFEVAFYGTELKVTLIATKYSDVNHQAYVVALVDGEEDPTKGEVIVLNQAEAEYTLASGLENGYHKVKLLKRSEAIDSDTAVKKVTTDGYFTTPPLAKSFKLQFIAASSSTGYGNLGSPTVDKTSGNSDGLRAFAYLTSFLLDSEISIFSASGWGVTRGWNTSGQINEIENIPNGFLYTAIDASNKVLTGNGKWNISNYVPDVLVVNLGTNDFNASGYSSMTLENKLALVERFKTDYTNFLVLLNNMYPNAKIIVAYGLMNEQKNLETPTLEIVSDANTTIGKEVVYSFVMEGAGTLGNPYGSNSHPNVQTSMNVAEDLAAFISTLTGREVLREMID